MTQELKTKRTQITIKENSVILLKENSKAHKMSLSTYVNFILNSFAAKEEPLYAEKINSFEKKEVESRVFFTISEMSLS